jgi:hypothetical protein
MIPVTHSNTLVSRDQPYQYEDERKINSGCPPQVPPAIDKATMQAKLREEHVAALVLNLPQARYR